MPTNTNQAKGRDDDEGGSTLTKFDRITELYLSTVERVTGTPTAWLDFLQSACRNFKCSFDEQILIHAQRPNATAVLEIERWNKPYGRWVKAGTKR